MNANVELQVQEHLKMSMLSAAGLNKRRDTIVRASGTEGREVDHGLRVGLRPGDPGAAPAPAGGQPVAPAVAGRSGCPPETRAGHAVDRAKGFRMDRNALLHRHRARSVLQRLRRPHQRRVRQPRLVRVIARPVPCRARATGWRDRNGDPSSRSGTIAAVGPMTAALQVVDMENHFVCDLLNIRSTREIVHRFFRKKTSDATVSDVGHRHPHSPCSDITTEYVSLAFFYRHALVAWYVKTLQPGPLFEFAMVALFASRRLQQLTRNVSKINKL